MTDREQDGLAGPVRTVVHSSGGEINYGRNGERIESAANVVVLRDESGRVTERQTRGDDGTLLSHTVRTCDAAGRVVEETEYTDHTQAALPAEVEVSMEQMEAFEQEFGTSAIARRARYTYDANGSCVEQSVELGETEEAVTTFRYLEFDTHGNWTQREAITDFGTDLEHRRLEYW